MTTTKKRKNAPGTKLDPGWEHGTEMDKAAKRVRCNYCQVVRSGGIFRLKHHLASTRLNVEPCLQAPDEVKEKIEVLLHESELAAAKKNKKYVDIGDDDEYTKEVDRVENASCRRGKGSIMDSFISSRRSSVQTTLNQKKKERKFANKLHDSSTLVLFLSMLLTILSLL